MAGSGAGRAAGAAERAGAGRGRWPDRDRLAQAAVTGAATALWYALPDHVTSRTTRAWVKAALAAVLAARSLLRDRRSAAGGGADAGTRAGSAPPQVPAPPGDASRGGDRVGWVGVVGATGFAGVVVSALLASAVVTATAERVLHRLGQRAARRGVRYAHTRNGVVLGVFTAVIALGAGRGARR